MSLQDKVVQQLTKTSWLSEVLWWLGIGTGVYLFITLGGFPLLLRLKNKAIDKVKEDLHLEKKKKHKALKGIKSFKAADDHGNETMDRILQAMGIDIDDDED